LEIAPNYTVIGQGKGHPEMFDRRAIRIHIGDNKMTDGSDSAESGLFYISYYRLFDW
jgi:hypothetical protein